MSVRTLCMLALAISSPCSLLGAQPVVLNAGVIAGAPFEGKGSMPLSSTTVATWVLEPVAAGGARVGFVLLIKGHEGWYKQPTSWTLPVEDSSHIREDWSVGPIDYRFDYYRKRRSFEGFGATFDLAKSNLLLATVDSVGRFTVAAGPRVELIMPSPQDFWPLLLKESEQARSFAGVRKP